MADPKQLLTLARTDLTAWSVRRWLILACTVIICGSAFDQRADLDTYELASVLFSVLTLGWLWTKRCTLTGMWLCFFTLNALGVVAAWQEEKYAGMVLSVVIGALCVYWAWQDRKAPTEHAIACFAATMEKQVKARDLLRNLPNKDSEGDA